MASSGLIRRRWPNWNYSASNIMLQILGSLWTMCYKYGTMCKVKDVNDNFCIFCTMSHTNMGYTE